MRKNRLQFLIAISRS
ncbi:hypothetical protein MTR67_051529 [Solanum verrucosum]|uniref:Uncharacterized protein n=1 Tax=Solanum verrucosum TaxID=315347 RepID=A0AAF1A2T9_SOLVR|nr:hypothetical protein MTR67_051529 [Solanum verrucosum]